MRAMRSAAWNELKLPSVGQGLLKHEIPWFVGVGV